ncbi:hypothetical protein ACFPTR_03125 [Aliibacillus thermotolerans]|uniref:Uncharacterized protein n=1 Tax=Aliibacillus thermotolerans TaxID=1834418 RepID=A0ABW0U542_9BACI|nr:hypothetical protein [Aliibacillus thermotolerans]MDA3129149.1 hypothetical protein [Aliibacillus thermotolerans]
MLVRLLNISVVVLILWIIALATFATVNPAGAEELFSIPWIKFGGLFINIVLFVSAVTNLLRIYHKEKEVRLVHLKNAIILLVIVTFLIEWKNDWPVIRSLF